MLSWCVCVFVLVVTCCGGGDSRLQSFGSQPQQVWKSRQNMRACAYTHTSPQSDAVWQHTTHTAMGSEKQREGVNDVMGRPLSAEHEGRSLFWIDSGNFLDGRRTVTSRCPAAAAAWEKRLYLKCNTNIIVHMWTQKHAAPTPSSTHAAHLASMQKAIHHALRYWLLFCVQCISLCFYTLGDFCARVAIMSINNAASQFSENLQAAKNTWRTLSRRRRALAAYLILHLDCSSQHASGNRVTSKISNPYPSFWATHLGNVFTASMATQSTIFWPNLIKGRWKKGTGLWILHKAPFKRKM